jgi:hypothetical protein
MTEIHPGYQLYLTDEAVSHIATIRKWAMFFAVVMFLASGFLIIFGLLFTVITRFAGELPAFGFVPVTALSVLYIGLGVVYFFPAYYLLRFSTYAKQAIAAANVTALTDALRNLKSHYVFIGVGTIVAIILYVLVIVGVVLFAVFSQLRVGA